MKIQNKKLADLDNYILGMYKENLCLLIKDKRVYVAIKSIDEKLVASLLHCSALLHESYFESVV